MGPARLPGAGSERIPVALMADYQPRYPLARESTVKHDLVVIKIMRESVMDCDPSHMLKLLKNFTTTRPQIVAYEGRITFVFDGWDDNPRETAEIPEIRAYSRHSPRSFLTGCITSKKPATPSCTSCACSAQDITSKDYPVWCPGALTI